MAKQLTLFCLVKGDPTSRAFPLTILPTETIGHLKKLIKAEMAVEFNDVDASTLTLWLVSVAVADYGDESPILLDTLNEKMKLHPTSKIAKVFGRGVPEDSIHIIVDSIHIAVQRPATDAEPTGVSGYGSKPLNQGAKHSVEHKVLTADINDPSPCQKVSHRLFSGWRSLPIFGRVDRDGLLLCTSSCNTHMLGYTSDVLRSVDRGRGKSGQGTNTVLIPIMEGEDYNIQGAESVWFMGMQRPNVK
ncbi:hypothetical protein BG011_008048 [Mortierella polycephala]|uniref:Crinkler effector protein N-terminal domain-containing protein n=1 Tax=Mortierella polycephala TaxID=41804 RepID=A0A9P6TX01_9FUNG|nr:hypothetical protein BG011_008048 [Mortierella polycephala]